ncbi:MAG: hypothetical protein AAB091_02010 [Elusimicrobiota bacterium]
MDVIYSRLILKSCHPINKTGTVVKTNKRAISLPPIPILNNSATS